MCARAYAFSCDDESFFVAMILLLLLLFISFHFDCFFHFEFMVEKKKNKQKTQIHIALDLVLFPKWRKKIVKQPNLCLIVVVSLTCMCVCMRPVVFVVVFFSHFMCCQVFVIRHGVEAKISTRNICLYDFIMSHSFFFVALSQTHSFFLTFARLLSSNMPF